MPHKPNVLLIVADDHRADALGRGGDPAVRTPTLDALAAAGVALRNARIMGGQSGAVCVPTRASLLTGVNPLRAVGPGGGIPPGLALLPAVFREAGYVTHGIGKWHNGQRSFASGFVGGAEIFFGGMSDHRRVPVHDFDAAGAYPDAARRVGGAFSTDLFTDAAVRFLRTYAGTAPFLLYLAFTAPHDPRTPPSEYAALYDPADVRLPPNFLPRHPFDNGELEVRDERLAPLPRTADAVRRHLADYYGMITHLDAGIGRVLDALRRSGRDGDTVVAYTADHGLAVGQHGLLGKQNLYECTLRVPLILAGPGLPAGCCVDAQHHSCDLLPTLCDLADLPVPGTVETRSLLPLVAGEPGRSATFALYKDVQSAVCDGRWKLIRYRRSAQTGRGTDRTQFFDLLLDPWESDDRSGDAAVQPHVARLGGMLTEWERRAGDAPW